MTLDAGKPEARDKLIAFGTEMYGRGLDKSDEMEADRLGVAIAARGGYDSYGLPSVLQTLQAMNPEDSALALMFKTHPSPAERLDALGSDQMQPVLEAYSSQPQVRERFVAEMAKTIPESTKAKPEPKNAELRKAKPK
jgi:predicted Zn-dependent protease